MSDNPKESAKKPVFIYKELTSNEVLEHLKEHCFNPMKSGLYKIVINPELADNEV